MIEKMTLEKFDEIKKQLTSIDNQLKEVYNQYINNKNKNDYISAEQRLEDQYLEIQNRLFNYDLSGIPFEAWQGIEIVANEEHIADLSKTRANIDFDIVDCYGNSFFKGCNIRNLSGYGCFISPEYFDENTIIGNPNLFLSDLFSDEFKEKFYSNVLTFDDLLTLSSDQIEELKRNQSTQYRFNYTEDNYLYKDLGMDKIIKLKNKISNDLFDKFRFKLLTLDDVIDNIDLSDDYNLVEFIPHDYNIKHLNSEIGYDNFIKLLKKYSLVIKYLTEKNNLYYIINDLKKNFDRTQNLEESFIESLKKYLLVGLGHDNIYNTFSVRNDQFGKIQYTIPKWLSQINFQIIESIETADDLLNYNYLQILLNASQRKFLDKLNIENIKKFASETNSLSNNVENNSKFLEMFNILCDFFKSKSEYHLEKIGIDFKNDTLSYEDFLNLFANILDAARKEHFFSKDTNYDWIKGEFRYNYPDLFMDLNDPEELKAAFYEDIIDVDYLLKHDDYIPYLLNKKLSRIIKVNIELIDDQNNNSNFIDEYVSRYGNEKFLELVQKYGTIISDITIKCTKEELDNEIMIEKSIKRAIYDKITHNKINYKYLENVLDFYTEYPELFVNFEYLTNIPQEERQRLTEAFYNRKLSFDDIKKYPELSNILKDKNLFIAFGNKDGNHYESRILLDTGYGRTTEKKYSDLELLQIFGNDKFLQLCSKYGRYMDGIAQQLNKEITIRNGKYIDFGHLDMDFENGLSIEEISKRIESIIARESKLGNIAYNPDDAPDFLKENYQELFLEVDAPEDLKKYFYNYNNNYPMTFEVLQMHKDWLPFLKNKALTTSLLRNNYLKKELMQYLELFGEEKGIKLGINRAETVKEMMKANKVELMKNWYDKTGGKFIPDYVVMQNFRIEEADKFLASGSNWSNLMKIKSFAQTLESREAMLKLGYSFGAFDQDQKGFKKLQELLTGLPKKIDSEQAYIFEQIDKQINIYSQRRVFFGVKSRSYMDSEGNIHTTRESFPSSKVEESYQKMIEYVKNNSFIDLLDTQTLLNLLESLKQENVEIDFSKNIFTQIYRKNEDGSYTLTINAQSYPNSSQAIRNILGKFREVPVITPDKAHQLFGAFELKYDADFREFLLANMDKIMTSPQYVSLVASIQRQFSDIKAVNSNRTLTLELAISYVQTNKYSPVNVGNERAAEISAIAGYSQADFDTLQQIYNYGKQRTFSSIPRIEKKTEKTSGKYIYETLRLDDPLAMAIGTLTDCCQELNNCAEVCMEHSMVDKNGRVFVIKDEQGNIVAQSWVWRNKDVLCFDNIEIPDKAFARAVKENPNLGRKGFTDEVFEIYKQAAQDLIEADEVVYKKLFDNGKITQEQYDGLRLGKVTVGLGYNDIAQSLKQNSQVDKGTVSRPLPFDEPVKLSRALYTNDSITQYILEEREDRKEYDGDTISVHNDTFVEYNDSNFNEKDLFFLEKLEIVTKDNPSYLQTSVSDYSNSEHLVTELARNYGLNTETTRIIMNPNFAIIYDINGDKLRVGDLLFNTKVDNEGQQIDIKNSVLMQIKLALEQIGRDKKIDISELDENQQQMFNKAVSLNKELDIERGLRHAK